MNTDFEVKVDCGGCTKCCTVRAFLMEGDDVEFFERKHLLSEEEPESDKYARANKHFTGYVLDRVDGKCAYLGENGCTVYDKRPLSCRAFSCIELVQNVMGMPEAKRAVFATITESAIFAEGKRRLS